MRQLVSGRVGVRCHQPGAWTAAAACCTFRPRAAPPRPRCCRVEGVRRRAVGRALQPQSPAAGPLADRDLRARPGGRGGVAWRFGSTLGPCHGLRKQALLWA